MIGSWNQAKAPATRSAIALMLSKLWYAKDWRNLDVKLRTSIVEGISVFLSLFDQPDVADIFCPPPPPNGPPTNGQAALPRGGTSPAPAAGPEAPPPSLGRPDRGQGKVLALNMPAGTNPALARAIIGVMLKQAWLQALLRRPPLMKRRNPNHYFRPAAFICDEYQAFATVGQDDPAGDEQAFARTRQSRCIPIVATQSRFPRCVPWSTAGRPGAPCSRPCGPGFSFH